MLLLLFLHFISDVTNIPIQRFVAEAGKNITIPCPGVNEQSLVNALKWKTTTTIAHYSNGIPLVHNHRVSSAHPCTALIFQRFHFMFASTQWFKFKRTKTNENLFVLCNLLNFLNTIYLRPNLSICKIK